MEMDLCEMVIPRQFLCCKVCDDDLKVPKYLPCLHTFCYKCISKYIKEHTDAEGYFPCPTCATETTLSKEAAENIPDNILVSRLSSPRAEKVIRETLCRTCKNAGNFRDAIVNCQTCDDFLCENCLEAHNVQQENSNHDTQSMEDYHQKVPERPSSPSQGPIIPTCCEDYDPYDIGALFCVDCDKSVCADCHVKYHGDHRCAELMAVATNFEQKIQEPLTELENDKTELAEVAERLESNEICVEERQTELIKAVRNRTKVLCNLIHDYENLLVEEIKKRHSHNIDALRTQRYDLNMHLAAIDGVRDFTDNLMCYGTYEEKVFMRKKVGFRIRELCEEPVQPEALDIMNLKLSKPHVTVETICNMFGELRDENQPEVSLESSSASQANFSTMDSGVIGDCLDHSDPELEEILKSAISSGLNYEHSNSHEPLSRENSNNHRTLSREPSLNTNNHRPLSREPSLNINNHRTVSRETSLNINNHRTVSREPSLTHEPLSREHSCHSETDSDPLTGSNNSDTMKKIKFSDNVIESEFETDLSFNLENPKRELTLPKIIQKEVIKGVGVNNKGDILIGTTTTDRQTIYVLEKHGIMKGQVPVENGWNIHSVSSDGKVALTIPRGDNRFKVRVLENDGTGHILSDSHVVSFGLNFVTADHKGNLLITSNRYAQIRTSHGKSAKSGGNIAFFDKDGQLQKRITNENFTESGLYLLEKPQCLVCDDKRQRFHVVDPGSHSVISFNYDGEVIFQYGNTDTEDEIYQGPDMVTFDKYGNVIVTDKREGRIDILSSKGDLKKCFYTDDIPRFVGTTPDKLLMTAMNDGTMKFYEYL